MLRLIVKLAIAALVANAAWRIGSAHVSYYKFKDAVSEEAQFGADKTEDQLRQRVLTLAQQYDLPVGEDDFTVTQTSQRTRIAGAYTTQIEVVPGFKYSWPFKWDVETINFGKIK